MTEQKASEELKEYADGWMTERKHTDAPGFLKFAFPVIGLCAAAYIVLQMRGDVGHGTRGPLVQAFNKVTQSSPAFQYVVMALALAYVLFLIKFIFTPFRED